MTTRLALDRSQGLCSTSGRLNGCAAIPECSRRGRAGKLIKASQHRAERPAWVVDSSSSSGEVETDAFNSEPYQPWVLMGRVIHADSLPFEIKRRKEFNFKAAANSSRLSYDTFTANLRELQLLLPGMEDRLMRINPRLLATLVDDVPGVAARILGLRDLLPSVNILKMVLARPSLLLLEEYDTISAGLESLLQHFTLQETSGMVEQQPLMLLEDIDRCLLELQRLIPQASPTELLIRDPDKLLTVVSNQKLSVW